MGMSLSATDVRAPCTSPSAVPSTWAVAVRTPTIGANFVSLAEQAVALTDSESPAYLPGFFQIALGSVQQY